MERSELDLGAKRRPWNAGKKLGAKRALKPQQVWAVRFRLDQDRRLRDRAVFDLAIDSKLRGCDLVKIKVGDLVVGGRVRSRAVRWTISSFRAGSTSCATSACVSMRGSRTSG